LVDKEVGQEDIYYALNALRLICVFENAFEADTDKVDTAFYDVSWLLRFGHDLEYFCHDVPVHLDLLHLILC
jgi:hypothetical protein